jgi:hypothetical protein
MGVSKKVKDMNKIALGIFFTISAAIVTTIYGSTAVIAQSDNSDPWGTRPLYTRYMGHKTTIY